MKIRYATPTPTKAWRVVAVLLAITASVITAREAHAQTPGCTSIPNQGACPSPSPSPIPTVAPSPTPTVPPEPEGDTPAPEDVAGVAPPAAVESGSGESVSADVAVDPGGDALAPAVSPESGATAPGELPATGLGLLFLIGLAAFLLGIGYALRRRRV
jgi:LPXTG-motif cell wall-anchored protein